MTNFTLLHAKPLGAHSAYAAAGKRAREFFSSENPA